MWDRDDLPWINERVLEADGFHFPGLNAITVRLHGGYRGAKYHRPAVGGSSGACGEYRYESEETATSYPLLEVYDKICRRCYLSLPPAQDALWRGVALLAATAAELEDMRTRDRAVGTWLGVARLRAVLEVEEPAVFADLMTQVAFGPGLKSEAARMRAAWASLTGRWQDAVRDAAAQCPPAEEFAGIIRALRHAGRSVARTQVDDLPTPNHLDGSVWDRLAETWAMARLDGATPQGTQQAVLAQAARLLEGARPDTRPDERPDPARSPTTGTGTDSEGQAAQASWTGVVDATCRELEAAIEHPPGDARRLLLVAGWPLTREGDRAEAFLSAFDQCGPAVPYGYRRGRGGMGLYGAESSLSYGTVLAVPEAIVDLLKTPHETRWSGRYLAGPRIRGAKPNEAQVHALLRRAFPFLPTDVSKDEAEPSEQIVQARRDAEAASTYQPTGQDSRYDRAYAFADGAHVWVPGDADSIEVVRGLIGYAGSGPLLRVDVECGRRTTGTFLARIYGGVLDVTADRIEFCAYGGHRAVAIPMHRIVSVSGAVISRRGQRRGREAQPIWDLLTDEADLAPVKVDAKTTRQQVSSLIAQALRAGTPARACRPQDMITIAGVAVDPRPGPSDTLTQWVDRIAADLKASRRQTMAHLGLAPGNAPARRLKELSAYLDEATLTAVQDATDVSSGLITAMAERSRPPADQMTDLIREVIASRGADGKTLGWSFTIPPALVARLGGADKARAAARTAAARLGWSVTTHNYGRWPGGQNGELVAVSSQRRIWRKRPAEPAPLPDRPSSPLEEPACQCGAGPCESGPDGYRSVFFAPWGRADTNEVPEITPATDLRTLPPRYRNKYFAHHLFAQTRWYDSEDMPGHFDLGPFLDGAPLGPLADVAVYCTDPFAEFAGKAHGVGCQHAPEIGQHHLVVPLTDFLPLLPHTGRQMFEADWSQDRWCTWCGGFAVRRLGASQCAHYRKVLTVKRGRSTIRKAPESSW